MGCAVVQQGSTHFKRSVKVTFSSVWLCCISTPSALVFILGSRAASWDEVCIITKCDHNSG